MKNVPLNEQSINEVILVFIYDANKITVTPFYSDREINKRHFQIATIMKTYLHMIYKYNMFS